MRAWNTAALVCMGVSVQFLLSGACLPRDDPRAKATSVAEVNSLLDRLAQAEKKEQQVRLATADLVFCHCLLHLLCGVSSQQSGLLNMLRVVPMQRHLL
jgi:hypothetical protein